MQNTNHVPKTTLLNDTQRIELLFSILPEIEFVNTIRLILSNQFISRENIHTFDEYMVQISRETYQFKNLNVQIKFEAFNESFAKLRKFLLNHFFLQDGLIALHPEFKQLKPDKYAEYRDETNTLCDNVLDNYEQLSRAINIMDSEDTKSNQIKSEFELDGKSLFYGKKEYKLTSTHKKNLITCLWQFKCKKKDVNKTSGQEIGYLAVHMEFEKSATKTSTQTKEKIRRIIKDTNGYFKKIVFPIHIQEKDEKFLLVIE